MTASNGSPADNVIALAEAMESKEGNGRETVAEALVRLGSNGELFHDDNGETYISAVVNGRRETWLLKSRGSREYLAFLYHSETGKVPGGQGLQDALSVLHGRALYNGEEKKTHVRIAHFDGKSYLDSRRRGAPHHRGQGRRLELRHRPPGPVP